MPTEVSHKSSIHFIDVEHNSFFDGITSRNDCFITSHYVTCCYRSSTLLNVSHQHLRTVEIKEKSLKVQGSDFCVQRHFPQICFLCSTLRPIAQNDKMLCYLICLNMKWQFFLCGYFMVFNDWLFVSRFIVNAHFPELNSRTVVVNIQAQKFFKTLGHQTPLLLLFCSGNSKTWAKLFLFGFLSRNTYFKFKHAAVKEPLL